MRWLPAAKVSLSRMVAFQNPSTPTVPPVAVKPAGWPLIEKRTLALARTLPSRSSNPEPLSEMIWPLMLNAVPATGLAAMLSTTRNVSDLTVMLVRFALVESKSVEPLNTIWTTMRPSGWS